MPVAHTQDLKRKRELKRKAPGPSTGVAVPVLPGNNLPA